MTHMCTYTKSPFPLDVNTHPLFSDAVRLIKQQKLQCRDLTSTLLSSV